MNAWNDAIAELLWTQFWQLTLIIVVIGAVVKLACRRRPHLAYVLWMIVLLKALTPPLWSSPTGLFSWVAVTTRSAVPASLSVPEPHQRNLGSQAVGDYKAVVATEQPLPVGTLGNEPSLPGKIDSVHSFDSARSSLPTTGQPRTLAVLAIVWLSGACGYLIFCLVSVLRIKRIIRRQQVASSPALEATLAAVSRRLRIKRSVQLSVVDAPLGPLTLGAWRPRIVLPQALASNSPEELEPILAHELIHIRRHDSLVGYAQILAQAGWWFHPLMWFVSRSICASRELCCDEAVVAELAYDPRHYGRSLLNVLELKRQLRVPLGVPGIRSFEVTRRRLEHLVQRSRSFHRRMPPHYWLVLVLGLMLLIPGAGLKRMKSVTAAGGAPVESAQTDAANTTVTKADASDKWSVQGRVVDAQGRAVADAEVLLLGPERIFVEAPQRTWFVLRDQAGGRNDKPNSTRTNARGEFQIERTAAGLDRIGVIASDPLFWVVARSTFEGDSVEIKLPQSGSLAIDCDLPGKPATQGVMIQLCTFDGQRWDSDALRFHVADTKIKNPGVTLFEHLPPGTFSVERNQSTKTGPQETLMTLADRKLVQVESGKQAQVRIDRAQGKPLKGKVLGLDKVDLRHAHISINYFGPEEQIKQNSKPIRRATAFDVIPITSNGEFTTDPIPPGEYFVNLFAMKSTTSNQSPQQSDFDGSKQFTVPTDGEMPQVEFRAKPRKETQGNKTSSTPSPTAKPELKVVNEDSQPVARFELKVWTGDRGSSTWFIGSEGQIAQNQPLWGYQESSAVQLTIRAPGYAPSITRFSGAEREKLLRGESTIVLHKGTSAQINFRMPEGMSWPAGVTPEIYFADVANDVHLLWNPANRKAYEENGLPDFDMLQAITGKSGATTLRVAPRPLRSMSPSTLPASCGSSNEVPSHWRTSRMVSWISQSSRQRS